MTGSVQPPPTDDDRLDVAVFHRYVTGESSPEEITAVMHWASTPARQGLLADARMTPPGDVTRLERVWAAIAAGIQAERLDPVHSVRSKDTGRQRLSLGGWSSSQSVEMRSIWYGAVVAVLSLLLVIAGWVGVTHRLGRGLPPKMERYTTANGQRATIQLTDGSTVRLDVASRLEVPADFDAGNHTVRLVGEALFTVSHHEGMPFTVLAGPTTTRVLGTSFLVRRYGTDTMTTVAVEDGRVAVGDAVVTASRLVEVDAHRVMHLRRADASLFGFATGTLTLPSMRLAQAIPELNRWFDADIQLDDSTLATKLVKGDVPAGSLGDLTELLTATLNVRVVRDGRTLTLYHK